MGILIVSTSQNCCEDKNESIYDIIRVVQTHKWAI